MGKIFSNDYVYADEQKKGSKSNISKRFSECNKNVLRATSIVHHSVPHHKLAIFILHVTMLSQFNAFTTQHSTTQ